MDGKQDAGCSIVEGEGDREEGKAVGGGKGKKSKGKEGAQREGVGKGKNLCWRGKKKRGVFKRKKVGH